MTKPLRIPALLPLLIVALLNTIVDLGQRVLLQCVFLRVYGDSILSSQTLAINLLFLIPFVLLLSPAGFLSDRYSKISVMQASAASAMVLTLAIALAYHWGWLGGALVLTFLLATQSAIFSPAKFGYLRELSGSERLTLANGLMQATTATGAVSGILIFLLVFQYLAANTTPPYTAADLLREIAPGGWLLFACATLEFLLTFTLKTTDRGHHELRFRWRRYCTANYVWENLGRLPANRVIWLSVVGLSLFWGLAQGVLTALAPMVPETQSWGSPASPYGPVIWSGMGLAAGSLLAAYFSRKHIETGLVPLGALGVVLTLLVLSQVTSAQSLAFLFLLLGLSGGLFVVPLHSLIQFHAPGGQLGRILAASNAVQHLLMLSIPGVALLLISIGLSSTDLLHLLTVVALAGALYTVIQLPQSLVRFVLARLFSTTHRIQVLGLDNLPGQGGVLLLGNHISWLDWAIVQIACPRPIHFVMHRGLYELWYLKWFLDLFGVIPIASGRSRAALAMVSNLLERGEVVCIFPEGSISRSGQLGEFKTGYQRAAAGTKGVIVPFYLRGLWGSRFSRSSERMRQLRGHRLRRDVIVAFGNPLPTGTQATELKRRVFDLSIDAWHQHTQTLEAVPLAWIRAAKRQGTGYCITDSVGGKPDSGYRALARTLTLSRLISRESPEQTAGILLPASSIGILANLATWVSGKTPVNLNYTWDPETLQDMLDKAGIRTLYSSKEFITRLKSQGVDLEPVLKHLKLVDMQALLERGGITPIITLLASIFVPARLLYGWFGGPVDIEQAAAIIFTAGTEARPKGVVLSHRNLMSNIRQISDVLDTRESDIVMASLPLFHAYGLTVTGLMPVIEGIPVVFHGNGSDTTAVAKAIARQRATILCGTPALLDSLAANPRAHPLMLDSLRLVVSGGGPLAPETRDTFERKFNKKIYEGYGMTETTPVASANIPDRIDPRDWQVQTGGKTGTVGMPLPGSSFRIVDPETLVSLPPGKEGLILIGGTQVMLGYLRDPDSTREVMVEQDGIRWYRTGDRGYLDGDGFLTLTGRCHRVTKTAVR
ncbi:MAG: MFS transporter [Gammaproteobacteria bacterium]|nr:MFS transporter [Gammaproteobacteria bacterium]